MNIFHVYLFGKIHLVSLVLAGSSVLYGISLQNTERPIIYRLMVSMMIVVFGHFMYENIFTAFYRYAGGVDAMTGRGLILYWALTIGLVAVISIANKLLSFIWIHNNTIFLTVGLLAMSFGVLGMMWYFGFFHELLGFYTGQTDPHGPLWAISKLLGFIAWTPLIADRERK